LKTKQISHADEKRSTTTKRREIDKRKNMRRELSLVKEGRGQALSVQSLSGRGRRKKKEKRSSMERNFERRSSVPGARNERESPA